MERESRSANYSSGADRWTTSSHARQAALRRQPQPSRSPPFPPHKRGRLRSDRCRAPAMTPPSRRVSTGAYKEDYLTWEQISELHRDGFEIGNHTRDHMGASKAN